MKLCVRGYCLRRRTARTARTAAQALLISAPTSTGKTFCAELALAGAIVRQSKGVLLVPLKSIAEEKFAEFEPLYRRLNLKCIIATADHPEYNQALERGAFDIAVCVYEKLNRALLANIDLLGRIGALIIDEAQLLAEPERGIALEGILLKLLGYRQASATAGRAAPGAPRLIALTASLASDRELAERLGARLIRETRRPVELRQGVLCDGTYRYFNRDTGEIGSEERRRRPDRESTQEEKETALPIAVELLERLGADRRPKLVFLSGRRQVIEAALTLASRSGWPRAGKAADELIGEEPSSVVRSLAQALSCGVAFHSADLTAFQRRIVERGFRSGEIVVIFCTTTLGLGVNLPAETVYIEPFKYTGAGITNREDGRRSRGVGLAPLPRVDFENIAGRAGRYRCCIDDGSAPQIARAVLLARTGFERDVLWENYIEPSRDSQTKLSLTVNSHRASDTFASLALEIIICGLAPTTMRLIDVFAALADCGGAEFRRNGEGVGALSVAIERLRELDLIGADVSGVSEPGAVLTATDLGRAAGFSGLSLESVRRFVNALRHLQPTTAPEWLALALSAPDFLATGVVVAPAGGGSAAQQLFAVMPDSADRLLACLSAGCRVPGAAQPSTPRDGRSPQLAARIQAFLALRAWRSGVRAHFLETRCRMSLAQVARLAQEARWLLQGLTDIASITGALNAESEVAVRLTALMNSLRYGLPDSALALRESLSQGVEKRSCAPPELFNRAELMELDRSDCKTAEDIAKLLATSGAKTLADTSINPAAALKTKQRRLQARLAARSRTPATSPTTQLQNNITQSHTKERVMREQVIEQHLTERLTERLPQRLPQSGAQPLSQTAPRRTTDSGVPTLALIPCSLRVDGAARGERFLLRVDGLPVALTGKSFKYLVKLVCARLSQPEGWVYKDDIEIGFNQARYLYRMRREIAAQLPGYRWSVYENNRLGYYRLALDSAALDVDCETLSNSPDYEVAQAVVALRGTLPSGGPPDSGESRRLG